MAVRDLNDLIIPHSDTVVTVEAVRTGGDDEMGCFVALKVEGDEYITFDQNIVEIARTWQTPVRAKFWRTSHLSASEAR